MDPLYHAQQELLLSQDALRMIASAPSLQHAELYWRNFLNHLEKVWVKAAAACKPLGKSFQTFQASYRAQRSSDPLLVYLFQARHADNHSIQEVAEPIIGALSGSFTQPLTIQWTGPELVVLPITNRGVAFPVPAHHLGQELVTRGALRLGELGCSYYAEYLGQVRRSFFSGAP
jgi:hypothetical protein